MDLGKVLAWTNEQNELVVKTEEGVLGLSFVDEDILRLRFNPGEAFASEETFVVVDLPPARAFSMEASPSTLVLSTVRLRVELGLAPLALAVFKDGAQQPLLTTPIPGMAELHGDKSVARFTLAADEHIYGLGQDPMARLDHRDQERRMWQEWSGWRRSGNAGIPFMLSSRGYAMLLNSSWPSRFAIGRAEVALPGPGVSQNWAPPPWPWGVRSGETHPEQFAILLEHAILDLFILCRPAVDELQAGYIALTGHAPLPPKWALGFIQCKNRYRSFTELISVAREYRRRRIPLDALVIDWLWFKQFGDLEWALPEWADPEAAFKTLADLGVHVLKAQHPFIDTNSLRYPIYKAKGFLNQTPEGTRPTYDHTNPAARQEWWNEIRRFYKQGLRGYWTDMGELEIHPPETLSHLGVRERVHNIYSLLWTKGLYEGQRSEFNERVFSLPRTAYAGIQRNGAAMWSGDISASWEVLRDQVVVGQGVCLSGQQYWTTDIGGFFTDERFTPELFVRWLQWGAFCPLFRTHGTRPDNEAWSFGEQAEGFIADAIRLRYRLMPYIYSLAHQVTEKGAPIMRAMVVDFPDDPIAAAQELQFMFGPALLVAPVIEAGARRRKLYLPQGLWYDF
jgi:alpha-glucosidase